MRNISLMAFASFLILWGLSTYLDRRNVRPPQRNEQIAANDLPEALPVPAKTPATTGTLISRSNREALDKIGDVINVNNVQLDPEVKAKIVVAKKQFEIKKDLRELEKMLEQSFTDPHAKVRDIKELQNKIVEEKNKVKADFLNTEKWEPSFVYYLMINENYSYSDVNQIQSLSENGFNAEELTYINEVVKTKSFYDKIEEFKAPGGMKRKIASTAKNTYKDDFIDNPTADAPSLEEKLIEMDYSHQQQEEMKYGRNQQE